MFGPSLFELGYDDAAFRLTVTVVSALSVLALVFIVVAVVLRMVRSARQQRSQQRRERWQPLLADVLAGLHPPRALRETVGTGETHAFLVFLSDQLPAAETQAQRARLRTIAAPLLPAFADSVGARAADVRARRVQVLGRLGGARYEPVVQRALDDESPLVAMVALQLLVGRGTAHAADAVIQRLPHFHSWSLQALATLLSGLGPAGAPALRSVFADERAALRTRLVAAATLQRLADPEAADAAAALLTRGGHRDLMTASLRLLGQAAHPRHQPLLRDLARSDDEVIRIRAFSTLTHLGAADAALLRDALHDPSRWVAIQAARGLIEIGQADVLRDVAQSDQPRAALARQILSERRTAA